MLKKCVIIVYWTIGIPGYGGYEPEKEDKLDLVVEWKPAAQQDVRDLLGDGEDSQDYPVCHPVDIFLTVGVTTSDLHSYQCRGQGLE